MKTDPHTMNRTRSIFHTTAVRQRGFSRFSARDETLYVVNGGMVDIGDIRLEVTKEPTEPIAGLVVVSLTESVY